MNGVVGVHRGGRCRKISKLGSCAVDRSSFFVIRQMAAKKKQCQQKGKAADKKQDAPDDTMVQGDPPLCIRIESRILVSIIHKLIAAFNQKSGKVWRKWADKKKQ